MGEPEEVQLRIMHNGAKEITSMEDNNLPSQVNQSIINKRKKYYRWFLIALYSAFVLLGQSIATLLGGLYYQKGGRSKWLASLIQLGSFPILLPYYCISLPKAKNLTSSNIHSNQPCTSKKALMYVSIGLLIALDGYLNSIGLRYLSVSTFSLITISQLAFNAFFSKFLNSLKFTPCIINSLVLLAISSILLMLQHEPSHSKQVSKKMHVTGFICTIAASAGYGLVLSLTQFTFCKVIKKQTFKVVMDMIIYQSLVATTATLIGLFASGEWGGVKNEMEKYEMGKASYVLNLTFTAINYQVFNIGSLGLIFEVSSLFSNAISILGVPLVPILAVIFFEERMTGIKAISMVIAVWGFISYVYQQYLDDNKSTEDTSNHHAAPDSPLEEIK